MLENSHFAALVAVLSLLLSQLLSSLPAFYLYRRYVFRVTGTFWADLVRFQGVYIVPFLANLVFLPLLVLIGLHAILAQALIVVFNAVISYFGHKYFSFKRKGGGKISDEERGEKVDKR